MNSRIKLKSLFLGGYKSFRYGSPRSRLDVEGVQVNDYGGRRVEFGDVTVLLGANGAGKSNVVSFFRMLAFLTTGALQEYIAREGTAESLLHYGSQQSPRMDAELVFSGDLATDVYTISLSSAAPDTLVFTNEAIRFHRAGHPEPLEKLLGSGHKESMLESYARTDDTSKVIFRLLRGCWPYHFHDTSDSAKIRKAGYLEDARYLRSDAGNLAAYLLSMRQGQREYYDRIVRTIQQICPQFSDFVLEPSERNPDYIILNWREKHHPEYLMGPHQLSDGTLRFMALTTLFLQPPEKLPPVVVIDEPELGLHPTAIAALAGFIKGVVPTVQTILATESRTLIDHFDLVQIRPIEHRDGESGFLELPPDEFSDWVDDYSTGELWEKNMFGGGPRYE